MPAKVLHMTQKWAIWRILELSYQLKVGLHWHKEYSWIEILVALRYAPFVWNGTFGFGCVVYGYCTSEQKCDSRNLTSNSICLQFTEVALHDLSPLTAATRDTAKSLRHFTLKLNLTKTGESACSIWTLAVCQMSPTSYLWKRKRKGNHNAQNAWLSFHLIFFQVSIFCC